MLAYSLCTTFFRSSAARYSVREVWHQGPFIHGSAVANDSQSLMNRPVVQAKEPALPYRNSFDITAVKRSPQASECRECPPDTNTHQMAGDNTYLLNSLPLSTSSQVMRERQQFQKLLALLHTSPELFPLHIQRLHYLVWQVRQTSSYCTRNNDPKRVCLETLAEGQGVSNCLYAVAGFHTPELLIRYARRDPIEDYFNLCRSAGRFGTKREPRSPVVLWLYRNGREHTLLYVLERFRRTAERCHIVSRKAFWETALRKV